MKTITKCFELVDCCGSYDLRDMMWREYGVFVFWK
jgi:hypothetical protein